MDVIKKIDVLLDVVKQALAWQAKYGKNSFPVAHVKELRRHLKKDSLRTGGKMFCSSLWREPEW